MFKHFNQNSVKKSKNSKLINDNGYVIKINCNIKTYLGKGKGFI